MMQDLISKTTVVFARSFTLPGFDEMLPAGDYDVETELCAPPDHRGRERWKASVQVHLHPRISHPGLVRSLTVSLADLEHVRAKDKLSGKELSQFFLDKMLADPMIRLVMEADGVSEAQIRHLYDGSPAVKADGGAQGQGRDRPTQRRRLTEKIAIQAAENEGMPVK